MLHDLLEYVSSRVAFNVALKERNVWYLKDSLAAGKRAYVEGIEHRKGY